MGAEVLEPSRWLAARPSPLIRLAHRLNLDVLRPRYPASRFRGLCNECSSIIPSMRKPSLLPHDSEEAFHLEAERMRSLDRDTQRQIIAIDKNTAANRKLAAADRDFARRRAAALERLLGLAAKSQRIAPGRARGHKQPQGQRRKKPGRRH